MILRKAAVVLSVFAGCADISKAVTRGERVQKKINSSNHRAYLDTKLQLNTYKMLHYSPTLHKLQKNADLVSSFKKFKQGIEFQVGCADIPTPCCADIPMILPMGCGDISNLGSLFFVDVSIFGWFFC